MAESLGWVIIEVGVDVDGSDVEFGEFCYRIIRACTVSYAVTQKSVIPVLW